MEELKCVHKGCGKKFTDPEEPCVYHPGPPEFHEGQKGWKCCKPRVLTFDEFMNIPPCTTGKHSTVDDTPVEAKKPMPEEADLPRTKPILRDTSSIPPPRMAQPQQAPSPSPAPPESDSDDPAAEIKDGTTCKRRGCGQSYSRAAGRGNESCVYHPGQALFHEGSKGWTCCKRRVLEFDEFMKIEGCKTKSRHLFVGNIKGKSGGPEIVETVRNDFYQTPASLMASFYLKKIDAKVAKVDFSSPSTVDLDLPTTDNKRYKTTIPLYGLIDTEKSSYKIMGTKLELTLVKSDGLSWPVLRSDDRSTGEIIQVGRAGRA